MSEFIAQYLRPDLNTFLLFGILFWINKLDARITCREQFLMEHGFDRRRVRHNA